VNTFLSSSQLVLQEQYLQFVKAEIAPCSTDLESGKLSPQHGLDLLAKAGYLALTIPREYGGQGLELIELVLFTEAISAVSAGLGLALASHYAVVELIKQHGSETQKSRYLSHLAKGELVGAQAFGEEMAGSDFRAVSATAVKKGNQLFITGEKTWVVNGQAAGLLAVLVKLDEELAIVLVDGTPSASMKVGDDIAKLGLHAAFTNNISFNDHPVAIENLLGDSQAGSDEKVLDAFDVSKTVVAAVAVGVAEEALKHSAERARTREQFGQPISKFQGIQWKLADHSVESDAARLMTYRAAWSQKGAPHEFRKFAAMAKAFAARVARFHSGEAVQIFGMLGASVDSPVERLYRDAKLTELFEGTTDYQKVIVQDELGV
jgi:alkylation response protein AidB-like acyl-CoA dehydrogenase